MGREERSPGTTACLLTPNLTLPLLLFVAEPTAVVSSFAEAVGTES